ncbi:hypothetical protein H9Y05_00030 [Crocinitomicaceae bacterium CZZ-1]|uniref:Uncharacterized protein n=1 Tax=Taishania pollutisoli TaxID=2766479 RepID=A0A8J6PCX0_9FLAO|nr:hypothetical protein [Taishania pollutisoli]MBC9810850.1 hypothetical protein [Taishania pollutisoli]MBX2949595.1 hypothetical protein [Crocinitomicaceae bacterium]
MEVFNAYNILLSPTNILSTLLFLTIVIAWTFFKSSSLPDKRDVALFRRNVVYKLFFSFVFGLFYLFFVEQGGDTFSYWTSSGAIKKLLFHNFDNFWEVMTNPPTTERLYGLFNYNTGYPYRFIYLEEESFFVAKILAFFRIITFDSYFACTALFAFIAANATWKIYTITSQLGIFNRRLLPVFVLFLPSVAFWSSGVSKDTVVFVSILFIIYYLYKVLKTPGPFFSKLAYWWWLLFFTVIIYHTRPFILYAMLIPLILMYSTSIINKIQSFAILRLLIKSVIYVGITGAFVYVIAYFSAVDLLNSSSALSDAMIVQQDFEQNTSVYGGDDGKRYSLGEIEYTPVGILKVVPASIIAGIYRPFLWEALRPSLIFNGLESVFFVALTIWFFVNKFRFRLKVIQSNEILMFAAGFVLVIAFMAGFTSIIFGVLVRIRAPLLPFLGLILSIDYKSYMSLLIKEKQESEV